MIYLNTLVLVVFLKKNVRNSQRFLHDTSQFILKWLSRSCPHFFVFRLKRILLGTFYGYLPNENDQETMLKTNTRTIERLSWVKNGDF